MAVTSVSDLKAHLSAWLEAVQRGEEVVVTDRGRPVATLTPIRGLEGEDERTVRLIAAGVLRPVREALPPEFWDLPRPRVPGNAAVEAILAERAEGR